jgi:hypothetical protein
LEAWQEMMYIPVWHDQTREELAIASQASIDRGIYYGTLGALDPRTYTLDVMAGRAVGLSTTRALGYSLVNAVMGTAFAGYIGIDPLNRTPGYGLSPGDIRDRRGRKLTKSRVFWVDLKNIYM